VLQQGDGTQDVETRLSLWMAQHDSMIERWRAMLVEIRAASGTDYAMYAVANRELLDLALSGQAVVPAAVAAELEPAA
jgi:glutamate dehydrogenase